MVSQSFFFSQLFIHASISSNHWASSQQIVHRHTLQPMARKGFLPRQGSQSTSHSYWAVVPQFRTFGQHNYCWVDIISTKCIVGVFSGGRHWVSACIIAMVSNVLPLSCILHRLFFYYLRHVPLYFCIYASLINVSNVGVEDTGLKKSHALKRE